MESSSYVQPTMEQRRSHHAGTVFGWTDVIEDDFGHQEEGIP